MNTFLKMEGLFYCFINLQFSVNHTLNGILIKNLQNIDRHKTVSEC